MRFCRSFLTLPRCVSKLSLFSSSSFVLIRSSRICRNRSPCRTKSQLGSALAPFPNSLLVLTHLRVEDSSQSQVEDCRNPASSPNVSWTSWLINSQIVLLCLWTPLFPHASLDFTPFMPLLSDWNRWFLSAIYASISESDFLGLVQPKWIAVSIRATWTLVQI